MEAPAAASAGAGGRTKAEVLEKMVAVQGGGWSFISGGGSSRFAAATAAGRTSAPLRLLVELIALVTFHLAQWRRISQTRGQSCLRYDEEDVE